MPKLREVRESLLFAHYQRLSDDEGLLLLYDINTARSPDLPYWNYNMSDDECMVEFRFQRNDMYKLIDVMNFPDTVACYNGLKFDAVESTCIFLKRFAYPCRYLDMIPTFARPVPQLCLISNLVMDHAYTHWNHLLSTFNQPWLSANRLETFANAMFQKSGALQNCLGVVDGTVRPVSRPSRNQRVLYNGHKKVYALKFKPSP